MTSEKRSNHERRESTHGRPPEGTVVDRRLGLDRRSAERPVATGLERRRGRGRRLSDFTKAAEEGEMTTEQFLFLMAIEAFKKSNDRMFPTWSDVREVVRLLGYRKTNPMEIVLDNADDWTEAPDAPANVRPERWAERFTDSERRSIRPKPGAERDISDDALDALEAMEEAFGELADDDGVDLTDAA